MGIIDKVRDTLSSKADDKTLAAFRKQVQDMLALPRYTLNEYAAQVEEGMSGWTSKVPLLRSRSEVQQLKKTKSILDAFTPAERADPGAHVDAAAIRRAAAAAQVPEAEVAQVLHTFEQAETIHRWLRARRSKGQKIPRDPAELQELARDPRGVTMASFLKNRPQLGPKNAQSRRTARKPLIF
jgi:signal recognition particle GTPase